MHCATHRADSFKRLTAALLTVAVAGCWPATLVHSAEPGAASAAVSPARASAGFGGIVFGSDGLTAQPGASVKAAHLPSGRVFTSSPTGVDGRYAMTGLPAGEYDLAVETASGLYAAQATLNAQDGRQLAVSFALTAAPQEGDKPKPEAEGEKKEGEPKGDKPAEPQEPAAKKKSKKGGSFWRKPGGAAILIVGGGVAASALASSATNGDDDEDSMSPK